MLERLLLRKRNRLLCPSVYQSSSSSLLWKRRGYHELSFAQNGDPLHVLDYYQQQKNSPFDNNNDSNASNVTIEMKYAAWNPADVNQVQGKYPSLASPSSRHSSASGTQRTVAGAEGIGTVVDLPDNMENYSNSHSSNLKRGDVVVTVGGIGTFRSHVSVPPECVLPVFWQQQGQQKHDICPHDAIFFQLVGTAYNLLQKHHHRNTATNEGAIVQNAGNSAVATILAQMTETPILSFVRQRSNAHEMDLLHDYLLSSSPQATKVVYVQEEYIQDRHKLRALREEWNFQTAFNAVGGEASQLLLQLLQPNGHHVTYGGMSQQPVTVMTSDLIFRNLQLSGYWHSQWMWQQSHATRVDFVHQLVRDYYYHNSNTDHGATSTGILLPPVQVFALRDWAEALGWEKAQTGPIRSKVVFDLSLE